MSLRVVTYNVFGGTADRVNWVREVLVSLAADVVILQEVPDECFVERLAEHLGTFHYFARGNSRYHLALLSRFPIDAMRSHHPQPFVRQTILEASIQHSSGSCIDVVGLHPAPFPSVLAELWRLWEIRLALSRARHRGSALCLLAGDFNACAPGDEPEVSKLGLLARLMLLSQGGWVPRFAIRAVLDAGMTDCFRATHPQANGFTFGAPQPIGRIDYIVANEELAGCVVTCMVVRDPCAVDHASDHYPVIATFSL